MSRFSEPQDPVFQALNSSVGFDYRLAPYDIRQSLAHIRMLGRCGIVPQDDVDEIVRGLELVRRELEEDRFEIAPGDEDIHMAVERRLTELVGAVGGKLHTARSRNDQVATDVAMFVRDRCRRAREAILALMEVLASLAEAHLDWPMPGYTHLQRAQPVYLSHHLLAWFWKLRRDHRRFGFCLDAADELPLGAGALAGVNFATDRRLVAEELGFARVAPNSIDAVSNRDFVIDYVGAAALCATHLSQLGAEIVLWSSEEFRFCEVSDAFASGSSIMPQKKNPDAAELLRGKGPRVVSHLVGLHGMLHGLPLTYNKDLQEDKEHLFDAADTLELALAAAAGMLRGIRFRREVLAQAAADEFPAATDVADMLVTRGVPFREAHGIVASLVRHAIDSGRTLSDLSEDELRGFSDRLVPGFHELLAERAWLESKVSEGGTALERVREQLAEARRVLAEEGA
ncbi:MAG: argininosuccinate lyase [Thermoleophilaceae bacterium]|nr:argininosuccinate lyase [Thermoleophilaceae bacterium]